VRCWGANPWGQLGDGTTAERWSPPDTDVIADVRTVVAGNLHTCVLMNSGGVRCWGSAALGGGFRLAPTCAIDGPR